MNPYEPPQSSLEAQQKQQPRIKINSLRVGLVACLAFGLPVIVLIAVFYMLVK